jgi:Fe-S cluster assembly iron-binding protein IscA
MLTLTPAAASAILDSARRSGLEDDWALRLAADVDEQGDLRFGMGFDEEREADLAFVSEGVPLLVGQPSVEWLAGVTLDFSAAGFVFLPPQEGIPGGTGGTACNVRDGQGGRGGCGSCSGGPGGGCS